MPTCILCHRANFSTVYESERLEVIQCLECGLVRQKGCATTLTVLDESFTTVETYYERRSLVDHCSFRFDQEKLDRTVDIQEEIKNYLDENQKLLDVGCGTGEFIWALKELGVEAQGIEPDPVRASFARKELGVEVLVSPYKEDLFDSDVLDAISLIQVLEHMENPLEILTIANEHLKSGGLLVVDVPSFNNPRIILYRFTRLSRLVQHDFIPSHCYYFTRRTLSQLVEKAGFKVLKAQTGRYSVKFGENILTSALDRVADDLGIGGITLYARKAK